jgi:sulfur carrier protein ThiS
VIVKLKVFGLLATRYPGYDPDRGMEMELPDGARVRDALARLGVSSREGGIVTVGGQVRKADAELKEGDLVYVFHSVVGG